MKLRAIKYGGKWYAQRKGWLFWKTISRHMKLYSWGDVMLGWYDDFKMDSRDEAVERLQKYVDAKTEERKEPENRGDRDCTLNRYTFSSCAR